MTRNRTEINRTLDEIEILETADLSFHITEAEYTSDHEVDGKIRGLITPDSDMKRDREYPPVSPLERGVASLTDSGSIAHRTGFPETTFYAGIVRTPPTMKDTTHHKEGYGEERFTVDNLPRNGTIEMGEHWTVGEVEESLKEDYRRYTQYEYDILHYPSEQLPIVIRGKLHRDAREEIKKREPWELDIQAGTEAEKARIRDNLARRMEGLSFLSIEIEYRQSAPGVQRESQRQLTMETFEVNMESTFADLEVFEQTSSNYTYNPEKRRIEWRNSRARPGETLRYEIVGPIGELLDLGHITAEFRGEISGQSLTGTRVVGTYDRTGTAFSEGEIPIRHTVRLVGDIEIDPQALSGETTTHTTADIKLNDPPTEAFDKLEAVCQKEGITVLDIQPPKNPEPVRTQEGVFEITAGESHDGDDRPGIMEIKREYADEGVVYGDLEVTGKFTAMGRESEMSVSNETGDRVIRSDEGGLDTRGKTNIQIEARSASSDLNTDLINKIERGLAGTGTRDWGPEREGEEHLSDRQQRGLPEGQNESADGVSAPDGGVDDTDRSTGGER